MSATPAPAFLDQDSYLMKTYNTLLENPLVKQAIQQYDTTKHSCAFLENTLGMAENAASTGGNLVLNKANEAYDRLYVQPRRRVSDAYTTGVDKAKNALESSREVAVKTGTVGLGASVVAAQLALAVTAGGASLAIDCVEAGRTAGANAISKFRDLEKYLEDRIWEAVHEAYRLSMIPAEKVLDKASDAANSVLDILVVVIERSLGVQIPNSTDSSVIARVRRLASALASVLTNRAQSDVIDPLHGQVKSAVEQLQKSIVLVDLVRTKGEWALEQAVTLKHSVSELKTRFETEAAKYKTTPEQALMTGLRVSNKQLQEQLRILKQKGNQLLGDGNSVEAAISYLEDLEQTLEHAEDIYAVRDEVLQEARLRVTDLSHWTASLLAKKNE